MSDNLPLETLLGIIERLPTKSLIHCRAVSKTWKSLIDNSDFVAHYRQQHTPMQHLLVSYVDTDGFKRKYVSIVNDDTFPRHRVSLSLPMLVNMLKDSTVVGSSHGLLCLYGYYHHATSATRTAVLWNIYFKKAIAVIVPNVGDGMYRTVLGFCVCVDDPKIVKITHIQSVNNMESISSIPKQVEVFTLSKGVWRSPCGSNLPRKSIQFFGSQVVIDEFLYWLATDNNIVDGVYTSYNLIISFDMNTEEFREVTLPGIIARRKSNESLHIAKLMKSIVVLDCEDEGYYGVWKFHKMFIIKSPDLTLLRVPGFWKDSNPVVEIVGCDESSLFVCETCSKQFVNLGIKGKHSSFYVSSYKETLLLLDQPDFIIYDNGKRVISKPGANTTEGL